MTTQISITILLRITKCKCNVLRYEQKKKLSDVFIRPGDSVVVVLIFFLNFIKQSLISWWSENDNENENKPPLC